MKPTILSILLSLLVIAPVLADEKPVELVKVYCFSEALEAGFKDIDGNFYCYQLNKRGVKKKSLTVVDERPDAHVIAEFLGAEQFESRGEATYFNYGIAWTPSQNKNIEAAIIKVGDFSKAFSSEGINAGAAVALMLQTEEWIRENRETVLEKAKKQ